MAYEFALGANLKVLSHFNKDPGQRAKGEGPPLLILICHGFSMDDVGSGNFTTPSTALPPGVEVRFAVEHGKTSDTDDMNYCMKELKQYWAKESNLSAIEGHINRLYPDQPGSHVTNYKLGKGPPVPDGSKPIDEWTRSTKSMKGKKSTEWVDRSYLASVLDTYKEPAPFDLARVRKACKDLGGVFSSMTAPHAYTHLLCQFCREVFTVKT